MDIILNLSSQVYGTMVTDTVPKEPEADTPSGRAGGPKIIETVPKTPEADTPSGRLILGTTIFKSSPILYTVLFGNPYSEVGKSTSCTPLVIIGANESNWEKYNSITLISCLKCSGLYSAGGVGNGEARNFCSAIFISYRLVLHQVVVHPTAIAHQGQ